MNRLEKIALVVILLLGAWFVTLLTIACFSDTTVAVEVAPVELDETTLGRDLSFSTVGRGHQSGWVHHAGIVVRDRKTLEWVWKQFYSHSLYPKPVPEIDFDNVMWVCIFRGNYSTWGYTTAIQRIVKQRDAHNTFLRVYVLETNPNRFMYVKQEFSQPFHIVELERSELPVRFTYKERVRLR